MRKSFLQRLFLVIVFVAALFVLATCRNATQDKQAASTAVAGDANQPVATSVPTQAIATQAAKTPNDSPDVAFVSATELYHLKTPSGWIAEEIIPGAGLVMANSEAALERARSGSAIGPGDFVLNLGFLPVALLKEKELTHLGFQLEAPADVVLQSLLPLFQIGADPAAEVIGQAVRVSLRDEREAGMLTVTSEAREGMILLFEAGDGVLALVSTAAYPGEMAEHQEITYAIAAEVAYNGAQDALYGVLLGGKK